MASQANVVFMPWVRQGAASVIPTIDTLDTLPGAVTLSVALAINGGEPFGPSVRLLGPSDVTGINPRDIVRRDPPPNTAAFEDNHFAGIEFDRPDFPWLFTPAKAGENARLRPWLCLIVVQQKEGVVVRSGGATPLPSLEIGAPALTSEELPNLAESWLWAHGQTASDENTDTTLLRDRLAGDPQLSLSRLLCPRLLKPNTNYLACLVPTFEAGRKAGLGLPVDSSEALQSAWSTPPPPLVTLPVYDQWTFRTGAGGDFKTLAKLLRAQPAPLGLGQRPMDVSRPGFSLPDDFPRPAEMKLEGALKPMRDATETEWPDATQAPFQTALAAIVNAPATAVSSDPLLAPPLYGRWHAGESVAEPAPPPTTWFDELNLDPRHRAVAAFGTRVVQEHQEALMASAWEQAGDVQAANQRLRQLRLSLAVGESLHRRHVQRMETDALLRVAAPALSRARAAAGPGVTRGTTIATAFVRTALPLQAMNPAMRKLSQVRGPAQRRLTRTAVTNPGMHRFVATLNEATALFVPPPPPTMATFNVMREQNAGLGSIRVYQVVTAEAVAAMEGAPQFQIMPEGTRIRMPIAGANVPLQDNAVAAAFRSAAIAHLKKLNPARPWISIFWVPKKLNLGELRGQLTVQMQPQATLFALANALLPHRVETAPTPSPASEATPVSPVMVAPRFPQPMYEALRDLSQDLMLPGLEAVKENAVIGLRTNQRFVNAYMVGLNFELGRELLWRGYPTDQRGTYFNRFWDAAGAQTAPDVEPLHEWGDRALAGRPETAEGKFVMLMRSELLRRYPTASIYVTPAVISNGQRVPHPDPEREQHPSFRGSMPPDVTFVGFELTARQVVGGANEGDGYFVVIQEQPTEPRFGFESEFVPTEGTHVNAVAGPPVGMPLRGLQWRQNSAHMAGITRRLPVRIAIHASQFITPQDLPNDV